MKNKERYSFLVLLFLCGMNLIFISSCKEEEYKPFEKVDLIGTWVCIEEEEYINGELYDKTEYDVWRNYLPLVFKSSSSVTLDNEPYTYTLNKNTITIYNQEGEYRLNVVKTIPANVARMILEVISFEGHTEVKTRYRYLQTSSSEGNIGVDNCDEISYDFLGDWICEKEIWNIHDEEGNHKNYEKYYDFTVGPRLTFDSNFIKLALPDRQDTHMEYCNKYDNFELIYLNHETGQEEKINMNAYLIDHERIEINIYYGNDSEGTTDHLNAIYRRADAEVNRENLPWEIYGIWTCTKEEGYIVKGSEETRRDYEYSPEQRRLIQFAEETDFIRILHNEPYDQDIKYYYSEGNIIANYYNQETGENIRLTADIMRYSETELVLQIHGEQDDHFLYIETTYTKAPYQLIGAWVCLSDWGYEMDEAGNIFNRFDRTFNDGEATLVFTEEGELYGEGLHTEKVEGFYYYTEQEQELTVYLTSPRFLAGKGRKVSIQYPSYNYMSTMMSDYDYPGAIVRSAEYRKQ